MKSDIEIAQSVALQPITDIVKKVGIDGDDIELYGKYKAKLSFEKMKAVEANEPGKLILVTAINPTPAGEGKSTMSIGLADALNQMGKKPCLPYVNPPLVLLWGLKAGQQVVVMPKYCLWKTLIFTLLVTCMPLQLLIMHYLL